MTVDAIYQGMVHTAMRKPERVTVRAGSLVEARATIKAMFRVTTRVTNLVKVRDLNG